MDNYEKIKILEQAVKDVVRIATMGIRGQFLRGDRSPDQCWKIGLKLVDKIEHTGKSALEQIKKGV